LIAEAKHVYLYVWTVIQS